MIREGPDLRRHAFEGLDACFCCLDKSVRQVSGETETCANAAPRGGAGRIYCFARD